MLSVRAFEFRNVAQNYPALHSILGCHAHEPAHASICKIGWMTYLEGSNVL
jgi:hypothetical protein